MKLPCAVTRDLLPLYAEGMVEPETGELIGQHLTDCPACREKLARLNTAADAPVETAKPLQLLKKQIRRRRRAAAVIAALCVFIAVFTYFCHETNMRQVPWEEGLIEVIGVESRPGSEVFGEDAVPGGPPEAAEDVLVLRADSLINGTRETLFRDEDGTSTLILEGWTSNGRSSARDYNEMVFFPVPDRVIYDDGEGQRLLWGEALTGGVETLPRLALGYYAIMAAGLALVSGAVWFFLRRRDKSWIARQVFFAPLAYLAAHLLVKGGRTASYFMERDLASILVLAAAIYALLSLAWQAFLRRREER